MSTEVDARQVTINYEGGSLTMTVGNAKDLFGVDNPLITGGGEVKTVSVKGHPRTRVIGGTTKQIETYTYQYIQWPSGGHGQAAGGEEVMMAWEGSQGAWLSRVSGPLWQLGNFLDLNAPKTTFFTAKGGDPYGPFRKN
jgi:hypothetical protein